jgi:predicted P-loop ATPase
MNQHDPHAEVNAAAQVAVDFLEQLRPGGPWVLTAIHPNDEKYITTITVDDSEHARVFVKNWNGQRNLYYSVNPTRAALSSKAAKTDIAAIEFVVADLDPKEKETAAAAKDRYRTKLDGFTPTATGIIDSGNGLQALFRLDEPILLPDPVLRTVKVKDKAGKEVEKEKRVYTPEGQALIDDIEQRGLALLEALGGTAGTQNIDRILRLPGTVNLPSKAKAQKGRAKCRAKLIKFNGATSKLTDFPLSSGTAKASADRATNNGSPGAAGGGGDGNIDWSEVEKHKDWLKSAADLPADFSTKGKAIVACDGDLGTLNGHLQAFHRLNKPYPSFSEVCLALTTIFKRYGRYSNEQIAAALLADLPCNQHIRNQPDVRRAIERAIQRSYGGPQVTVDWRERKDGAPKPSVENARRAIVALGVECRLDTFHNEMQFGFRDDGFQHSLEHNIGGEIDDNGVAALRHLLSDTFGFDLTEKHVRDAVMSLALRHQFDPVCDMLAEAQAKWDGAPRLDRMAAEYLCCEDTPLNAAFIRKMMIGAVARARNPGCKFDTIVVFESTEGYNKSTAIQVLAGEENFSDEPIIGKAGREVQEQLGGVWIHENGEMDGMKKADVEAVKAYASRQVDRARPAYGRFSKKQARHSIEVGTTNADTYLQSQTGNRRFWPIKVLKRIDIDKLKRDRLQLWGEAAYYQSQGESLVLDEALWAAAGVEQEARRITHPWEDVLCSMPRSVEIDVGYKDGFDRGKETVQVIFEEGSEHLVSSATILEHVLKIPPGRQTTRDAMALAAVMKRLGWQRHGNGLVTINGDRVKGYFRRIGDDASDDED